MILAHNSTLPEINSIVVFNTDENRYEIYHVIISKITILIFYIQHLFIFIPVELLLLLCPSVSECFVQ